MQKNTKKTASSRKARSSYPVPGPVGGRLIRQAVSALREAGLSLPVSSHILIACSGGSDSVALAHLLAQYGRRGVARSNLTLLHIDHGWRGKQSQADARFVQSFAKKLGIPVLIHRLNVQSAQGEEGQSWEEAARVARKEIFEKEAARLGAIVLTAHQADDQAETLLWRLFTGAAQTHGAGISLQHGVEVRPLLSIRKRELVAYLREEKLKWREDPTNLGGRFLRSRMRMELMPIVEKLFPRSIEHLIRLARLAHEELQQKEPGEEGQASDVERLGAFFEASGLKLRRAHWEALQKQTRRSVSGASEVHLPKGWRVRHDPDSKPKRWIIEVLD